MQHLHMHQYHVTQIQWSRLDVPIRLLNHKFFPPLSAEIRFRRPVGASNAYTLTRAAFAINMYALVQHGGARLPPLPISAKGRFHQSMGGRQRLHADESQLRRQHAHIGCWNGRRHNMAAPNSPVDINCNSASPAKCRWKRLHRWHVHVGQSNGRRHNVAVSVFLCQNWQNAGFAGSWEPAKCRRDSATTVTRTRHLMIRPMAQHGGFYLPCQYQQKSGLAGLWEPTTRRWEPASLVTRTHWLMKWLTAQHGVPIWSVRTGSKHQTHGCLNFLHSFTDIWFSHCSILSNFADN